MARGGRDAAIQVEPFFTQVLRVQQNRADLSANFAKCRRDDDSDAWLAHRSLERSPPHPEKLPQQIPSLALSHRRINLRRVMAGWLREEPHTRLDRAALGIGGGVIQPP